tara:strand:- start:23 stop:1189 length:1167 start_codon:yes stop_codon:yes gene_type:complete
MEVRSFEAWSMREAIRLVRKDLGPNAVILETETKESARGKQYLVKATGESDSWDTGRSDARDTEVDQSLLDLSKQLKKVELSVRDAAENAVTRDEFMGLEASINDMKSIFLEHVRETDGSIYEGLVGPLAALVTRLKHSGISDGCISEIIQYLRKLPEQVGEEGSADYYQDHCIRWILKRVTISPHWLVQSGATRIHCIVGASGVGKSSVVIKTASLFSKNEHKSVLVVSVDQQRLAANDQMRVYSKVLGVKFESIDDPEDLIDILEKYPDIDLVLIDTPGLNPKKKTSLYIQKLKKLPVSMEFHLVLSTTDKESHMDHSVRSFSHLGIDSLIFSKLDESWSYGEIFNIISKWRLPLSFFGTGKNVPGDFERATRERLVERIFALKTK